MTKRQGEDIVKRFVCMLFRKTALNYESQIKMRKIVILFPDKMSTTYVWCIC